MNIEASAVFVLNFAVFSGIAFAFLLQGLDGNLWTFSLVVFGAFANMLAWRKLRVENSALSAEGQSLSENEKRERLMQDLGDEAQKRRDKDRLERN